MDYQDLIFRWASFQTGGTGASIFTFGLLYAFFGFRFSRLLLAVSAGGFGALAGWHLADPAGQPPAAAALMLAAGTVALALRYRQAGVVVAAAATFAALGYYLAAQFGLPTVAKSVCAAAGSGLGMAFAWLNRRAMPLAVTTVQGAVLMIVGFVGLSNALLPSLGITFVEWAATWSLLVPVLLGMLCVTAYSYQANAQQGDIRSGA
jgi:hypothetical protein